MPRREKYVPTHRDAPSTPGLKKSLRKTVAFSGIAVAATGVAVGTGIVLEHPTSASGAPSLASAPFTRSPDPARPPAAQSPPAAGSTTDRASSGLSLRTGSVDRTSRSAARPPLDPSKAATLDQESGGQVTHTEDLSSQDPRAIARALLPQFGFSDSEFSCLDALYTRESGWNVHADNPTSDAYGIPQALPGSKMASAGADWMNDAATQIRWGLEYIRGSYGTPCAAWGHETSFGWY
ncbi:MAG TPA: lytic transglycosylase domain-containing protein [Nocardioidaceae bacterium]|nr:lytic transglycosylase domain-containing protein [Nocardioidaceae bacterium]